ncbi:MAG: hypothetical protein Q9181_004070 [Wetmoreana brouardii]
MPAAPNELIAEYFYHFLDGWKRGPSYVWCLYDCGSGSSTYLLFDCPENAQSAIVRRAQEGPTSLASCPFAVDALIAAECCSSWRQLVDSLRNELMIWENNGGAGIPLDSIIHTPNGTESLHRLSRSFQSIAGDLTSFDERLDFLTRLGRTYRPMKPAESPLLDSAVETLAYYQSRNVLWKRWVEHYNERVRLMINLFFSIGSQADNRTNLKIASLTSDIAVDAQRDSSSMITIAAVTMVFLPGTFISVRQVASSIHL